MAFSGATHGVAALKGQLCQFHMFHFDVFFMVKVLRESNKSLRSDPESLVKRFGGWFQVISVHIDEVFRNFETSPYNEYLHIMTDR